MPLASRLRARLARLVPHGSPPAAPRFVVRVVVISFATVAGVLAAMSVVMVLEMRAIVERGIAGDLAAAQRQLAASQHDRQRDGVLRAGLISSSPAVQAVLESYQEQRAFGADAIAHHAAGRAPRRDRAHRGAAPFGRTRRRRPRRPRGGQRRSERAGLAARDQPAAHRRRRRGRCGPGDLRGRRALSCHRRPDRRGGRRASRLPRRRAAPGQPLRRGPGGRGSLRHRGARRRSADRQHVDRPGARDAGGAPAPPRSAGACRRVRRGRRAPRLPAGAARRPGRDLRRRVDHRGA